MAGRGGGEAGEEAPEGPWLGAGGGERRVLESGPGSELREDPIQHIYFIEEENRRPRDGEPFTRVTQEARTEPGPSTTGRSFPLPSAACLE